jgi:hypothetical protein
MIHEPSTATAEKPESVALGVFEETGGEQGVVEDLFSEAGTV